MSGCAKEKCCIGELEDWIMTTMYTALDTVCIYPVDISWSLQYINVPTMRTAC